MNSLLSDLRLALRMLRKNPGFSAVAILALALGMGANSTIFSTLKAMVLRPAPFPELDRILVITEAIPKRNDVDISVAPPNYRDLAAQNHSFERIAAVRGRGRDANLTGWGAPVRLDGNQVTASFFPLLGISPLLGRVFSEPEAEAGAPVIVLSYGAWQRQFAADPAILTRPITLDGAQTQVLGVMPPEFDFPVGNDFWQPLAMTAPEMNVRGDHSLFVLGRLKPSVSETQALVDVQTIGSVLERQYPDTNRDQTFSVRLFRKQLSGATRYFVSILMWAAAFVLLLACANVANLQLARALGRQKELAVRIALGASRWRITRQVLVESTVLALAGGAAGLLIARWGLAVTVSAVPPFIVQHIAGIKNIRLDSAVIAFTAIVAVLTGILAGLVPALHAGSGADVHDALKAGTRGSSAMPVRRRWRSSLVVAEVALALVLLIGAGLMVQGFHHLIDEYPGYDAAGVLTARVALPENKYGAAVRRAEFYESTLERFAAIPGVESASAVRFVPDGWAWQAATFSIEGVPDRAGETHFAAMQAVSPDYFRQLRIPLLQGRALTRQDGREAPWVVVLSENVARRWWPAGDAVGHRIRFGSPDKNPDKNKDSWRTIVGVAANIRQAAMSPTYWSTAYVPISQSPPQAATLMLRTSADRDPLLLATAMREALWSVDADQPLYDVRTLRQLATDNVSGIEFSAHMMIAFGAIALLLAAAGIYAVMAYAVTQRTQEIGIRMALGAPQAAVQRMVVGNSLKLALIGLAIGLPSAFALTRLMSGMLFGMVKLNLSTFAAFTVLLALVAVVAGYLPARRATRVDPMIVLRTD